MPLIHLYSLLYVPQVSLHVWPLTPWCSYCSCFSLGWFVCSYCICYPFCTDSRISISPSPGFPLADICYQRLYGRIQTHPHHPLQTTTFPELSHFLDLLRWYHDALAILPACFFVPPDPTVSTFYLVFSQGLFSVSLASGFQNFNMSTIGLTAASPTGSHSCIY